eukprot:3906871-Pyramimonas_sp.AAC.1
MRRVMCSRGTSRPRAGRASMLSECQGAAKKCTHASRHSQRRTPWAWCSSLTAATRAAARPDTISLAAFAIGRPRFSRLRAAG